MGTGSFAEPTTALQQPRRLPSSADGRIPQPQNPRAVRRADTDTVAVTGVRDSNAAGGTRSPILAVPLVDANSAVQPPDGPVRCEEADGACQTR